MPKGDGRTVKRPKTPEQRIRDADARMDKLTAEVATLQRVLAAQNEATATKPTDQNRHA